MDSGRAGLYRAGDDDLTVYADNKGAVLISHDTEFSQRHLPELVPLLRIDRDLWIRVSADGLTLSFDWKIAAQGHSSQPAGRAIRGIGGSSGWHFPGYAADPGSSAVLSSSARDLAGAVGFHSSPPTVPPVSRTRRRVR